MIPRRRSRAWRWLCRFVSLKVFTLAVSVTWPLSPAHADASGFLPQAAASDTAFMSEMEDIIGYKLASEGTTITSSQLANLPAALEYGTGELAILEASEGVALVAGPVGWLGLALGYEAIQHSGQVAALANELVDNGSFLWNCLANGQCSNGVLKPTPTTNITAGSPYWSFSVSDGGNGKVYYGYGVDPDSAVSAAISVANSADGKLAATELGNCVVASSGTSAACNYKTYYSSSVSNNAAQSSSAPASCTSFAASALSSSGCTALSPTMPLEYTPPQLLEWQTPSGESSQQMSPQIEADLINKIWQEAGTDPQVEIPAPLANDPVTPADVAHERANNPQLPMPYMPDTLQPVVTIPSGLTPSTATPAQVSPATFPSPTTSMPGTPSNPTTSSTSAGTTTGTGTSSSGTGTSSGSGSGSSTGTTTSSSGSTLPPCGNLAAGEPSCEVDWNSTNAALPAAPADSDFTQIFSKLATLAGLSFWKSWTVSVPSGACQTFQIPFQGTNYTLDYCTPLQSMQGLIATIETALIAIATVTILLSA